MTTTWKIPDRLNAALVAIMYVSFFGLLKLASSTPSWLVWSSCLVAFALVFLTNFSLCHEGAHRKLHSDPRWNYALGAATGVLFPMPFSMFRVTHWNHHLGNRTDYEIFDLRYATDSALKKNAIWYGMLAGAWYWMIPPGSGLLVFGPKTWRDGFKRGPSARGEILFNDFGQVALGRARLEVLGSVTLFALVVPAIGIHWSTLAAFYVLGPMLWSSTQYLEHAYAPRDVIEGAFNLRASRWFSRISLHREMDLTHHRWPDLPWIHYPRVTDRKSMKLRYFSHYWTQWKGVQVTPDRGAPVPVKDVPALELPIR